MSAGARCRWCVKGQSAEGELTAHTVEQAHPDSGFRCAWLCGLASWLGWLFKSKALALSFMSHVSPRQ